MITNLHIACISGQERQQNEQKRVFMKTSMGSMPLASRHGDVILFATRSADGKPTVIPMDMQRRAKAINKRHDTAKPAAETK